MACFEVYVHNNVPGHIQDSEDLGCHLSAFLEFKFQIIQDEILSFFSDNLANIYPSETRV